MRVQLFFFGQVSGVQVNGWLFVKSYPAPEVAGVRSVALENWASYPGRVDEWGNLG
jgi:hypothetical protein